MRLVKENKKLQEQSHQMFDAEIDTRKQYIQDLEKRSASLIVQYDEMQIKFRLESFCFRWTARARSGEELCVELRGMTRDSEES